MTTKNIGLEISKREVNLILKYGYPFTDEKEKFKDASKKNGIKEFDISKYWLELIVGDLCRSIREMKNTQLQEELDCLCESIEIALKQCNDDDLLLRVDDRLDDFVI